MAGQTLGTGDPSPVLRAADSLLARLAQLHAFGAALCLSVMFVLLATNVLLRYLFASGLAWAYEIHALLLPWVVACGMVLAACEGRHVAIRLLLDRLAPAAARRLAMIVQALVLAASLPVLWASPPVLRAASFQSLSTLGIPQVFGYAALVWAFAALALVTVVELLRLALGAPLAGGRESTP